ncbi:unnamed protein product [Durusdinium trenchii]|uniref:Uncharacterized protein n=1 Tax=Durusdinium trenchii TaxID=1381693 RepID=A0ABP0QFT1_9DINO
MLLHSAPSGKGLAGRSLLDFFAKEDHTRISEQFQSSIASESTSVMALNADMLDSDQNHVKVELFHAQFQNLANKRSFLLGVREIQGGETVDPMTKASPSVDSCPAIGTPGALSVVFDVPSFEILVLSEDLEMLCQSCLGKTPENVVEISSVSKRKEFAGVLQTMTNHSFHSADADAGHAKEQTFTFNLLGAGEVTASFLAEYDMLLDTMVGTVKILSEVSAQPLKNVPNKSMMSRTSSRGSRASSGSAERPRKAPLMAKVPKKKVDHLKASLRDACRVPDFFCFVAYSAVYALEVVEELDGLRCRMTKRVWDLALAICTVRLVNGQLLDLFGSSRPAPQFDLAFFFLGSVGLVLNFKPGLISPRTLDAWYVGSSLIWTLTLLPASRVDVRDFMVVVFPGRFVFGMLAKRWWCFALCHLALLIQTLRMGTLQEQNVMTVITEAGVIKVSSVEVILAVYFVMFIAVFVARRMLQDNAKLILDLKGRTVELGAVSSLLSVCYDAVVEVDDSLSLTDDSRQLSNMLLHSVPSGKGLAGRSLLDFFAKEDHTRISEQFQSSIASESTAVMGLNADMLDSDQNHVKVELFHAQFQNLANKTSFLVGVREIQGGETAEPISPASPSVASCPAIGARGAFWVVFDIPSFDILVLSEDLESFARAVWTRLQRVSTFTLDLLGMGEVITSFLTESRDGTEFARAECERRSYGLMSSHTSRYDPLLETTVGIVNLQAGQVEEESEHGGRGVWFGRRVYEGRRQGQGDEESREGAAKCQEWWSWWREQLDPQAAEQLDLWRCRMTRRLWNLYLAIGLLRIIAAQVRGLQGLPRVMPEYDLAIFYMALVGLLVNSKPGLVTPKSLDAWYVGTCLLWYVALIPARYANVMVVMAFSFAGRFLFGALVKRVWCFLLCTFIGLVQLLWMARLQRQHPTDEAGPIVNVNIVLLITYLMMLAGVSAFRWLLLENAKLKHDLQGRTVELGAISSLLAVCYDAVVEVDETLQLMEDSRQLSSMLLHSGSKGLAGRSLLDFCAKEDHARISQLFQSSIASESTSVMALNADMLDSDQNHVKVEMFHAQFQNLANKRSFLVGVREIQAGEALGPMLPERSPSSAMRSSGATFVVFDVITFDILVLSHDLKDQCQNCLGRTPENILEISSGPSRRMFQSTLQSATNRSLNLPDTGEQKLLFSLVGTGEVTASLVAEYDAVLDTHVGTLDIQLRRPGACATARSSLFSPLPALFSPLQLPPDDDSIGAQVKEEGHGIREWIEAGKAQELGVRRPSGTARRPQHPTGRFTAEGVSDRPRRGVSPNVVALEEAFCEITEAVEIFRMEDEATKQLMHGAVCTADGGGGHVFFEDIRLNPFEATMKVSFEEYRGDSATSHVIFAVNVPDAPQIAQKMLASEVLGTCREVVPVAKQFWGAEFGILQDGCGFLWSLSTKSNDTTAASPDPAPVRSLVRVPDAAKYLTFLKEVFGDALVEKKLTKDTDLGLLDADLSIFGSGFRITTLGGAATKAPKATFDLLVAERPPGARSEMAKKLGESVSEEEHYSLVRLPCGLEIGLRDVAGHACP